MTINYLHKKQIALTTKQKEFSNSCKGYLIALNEILEAKRSNIIEGITEFISHDLDHILRAYLKQNEVVLALLNTILSKEMEEDSSPHFMKTYLFNAILENHSSYSSFSSKIFIEDILLFTNEFFNKHVFYHPPEENREEERKSILKVIESKIKVKTSEDGFQEWFLSIYKKHFALLSESIQLSTLATDFESTKSLKGLPTTRITEEVDLSRERSTCVTLFCELEQVLLEKRQPCSDHFFNNVCVANFKRSFSELTQENLEQLATILTALKSALNREKIQSPTGANKYTLIKEGLKHRGLLTKEGCVFYIDTISTLHESGKYTDDLEKQFTQGTNNEHWNKVRNSDITCYIIHAKSEEIVVKQTPTHAPTMAPTMAQTQEIFPMFGAVGDKFVVGEGVATETEGAGAVHAAHDAEEAIASIPHSIQVLIDYIKKYTNDEESATKYIALLQDCQTQLSQITDKDLSEYAASKDRCPKLPIPTFERKWKKETGDIHKAKGMKDEIIKLYNKQNETLTTLWKLQAGKLESFTKETLEEEVNKYTGVLTKEQETIIRAKIKELKVKAEAEAKIVAKRAVEAEAKIAAKRAAEAEAKIAAKRAAEAEAKIAAKRVAEAESKIAAKRVAEAESKKVATIQQRRFLSTAFKVAGVAVCLGALHTLFKEDGDGEVGVLALGFTQLFSTLGLASWGKGALSNDEKKHIVKKIPKDVTLMEFNELIPYPNLILENGWTPFQVAIKAGLHDKVLEMIEFGADLTKTAHGATPDYIASEFNHSEILKTLIKKGADVNIPRAQDNTTPLYAASIYGHTDCAKALLKAGAKVNTISVAGATPLLVAVQNKHTDTVDLLLKYGADVNKADNYGRTPLHVATQNGHIESVNALINAGAKVDEKDSDGETALHIAAMNGHTTSIKPLVNAGAKVDEANNYGRTPLHVATQNGHIESVNTLINAGAKVDEENSYGENALHIAAINGHNDVVNRLLEADADVNKPDKNGDTPLHLASQNGHTACVEALIDADANIDLPDSDGYTALFFAVSKGNINSVLVLLKAGANVNVVDEFGSTPLHLAIQLKPACVPALIEAGADVNKNYNGYTPLYVAAQNGHEACVQTLLANNATVDKTSPEGITPLYIAAQSGHEACVQTLLANNATVDKASPEGITSLFTSSQNGHSASVAVLLGYKANPNTKDKNGIPVIQIASQNGYTDVVNRLLEAGAAVDQLDAEDWTSLHWASQNGYTDVVNRLLEAGAVVSNQNNKGKNALHLAAYDGHTDVVKRLLEADADVNKPNKNGETPLHLASQNGHIESVESLIAADADVNQERRDDKAIALHLAAFRGHTDVVNRLLKADTNIDAKTKRGTTAIDLAREKGHHKCVQLLEATHAKKSKTAKLPL